MKPRFRADHVGSMLRPANLLRIPAQEIQSKTDVIESAIKDLVKQELARGVRPITNGEYERVTFFQGFFESLENVKAVDKPLSAMRPHFPMKKIFESFGRSGAPCCVPTGKIKYGKSAYLEHWLYLRSLLEEKLWGECKVTLPTPTWYHETFRDGEIYDSSVYRNDEEYFADIVTVFRTEIMTLYEAGVRNIQIDTPNLAFWGDDTWLQEYSKALAQEKNSSGVPQKSLDELFELYIHVHNDCLRDLPSDLNIGIHVCRGNLPGSVHASSGSYEALAERLLQRMDYKIYYLEFDSPRSGFLDPIRFQPANKVIVLGLVSTKEAQLENLDELTERVKEAADIIAKGQGQGRKREIVLQENIAVSPQCGFSSSNFGGGKGVTQDIMWKKLDLVRDLAIRLWGRDAVPAVSE